MGGEGGVGVEKRMVVMLEQHQESEQMYSREAFTLSRLGLEGGRNRGKEEQREGGMEGGTCWREGRAGGK